MNGLQVDAWPSTHPSDFGYRTFVVDVQPDVKHLRDEATAAVDRPSQCAGCNFVDFVAGVENPGAYAGLQQISAFFPSLLALERALTHADVDGIARVLADTGVRRCYEIVEAGAPGRLEHVAKVHVLRADGTGWGDLERFRHQDWALVEPGPGGPSDIASILGQLGKRSWRRALVGSYEHASAMDYWSEFRERDDFAEQWQALVVVARENGISELGFIMAYPPCAVLQLPANLSLERLRAQLDIHFRQVEDVSSMMCPENVSGYSLVNDTRDVAGAASVPWNRLALRFRNLLVSIDGA